MSAEGICTGNREVGLADNEAIGIAAAGPRQVGFTLNSDTPYGAAVLDIGAGPFVIEMPAGPFIGLVDDHHQQWVTDLGIPGPDAGHGGTYLIAPTGYTGPVPENAHLAYAGSNKLLLALRALPLRGDLAAALEALRTIRVYPLNAPDRVLRYVDVTAEAMDSTCLRWEGNLEYWRVLHRVLDGEPAVPAFAPMYGLLADLGIGRGGTFDPDERTTALLTEAARRGRDQLLVSAFAGTRPDRVAWPDRSWEWVGLVADNGNFTTPAGLDLEARDRWFAQAIIASPAMFRRVPGSGSLYWLAARDNTGAWLDGTAFYTLDLPRPVPGQLFWSVTVYDAATRSQIQAPSDIAALRSLFELRELPGDGPVRLHFGPTPPPDAGNRWLQTVPGRGWFAYLRIYGPEQAAFDGTWRPGDFIRTG
ncbi:DUF1214 domain-containing protein [Nocardia sp. NPDC057227]|uniref:DUF1214 domain-containing protein n=1 Tax=Nocardia sp. NPDC057227 TaxID=3346056 RepID=UPI00362FC194